MTKQYDMQNTGQAPSRTIATVDAYIKRAQRLELIARKSILQSMPYAIAPGKAISPMQLAVWLIDEMKAARIASSTYRQNKAALICSFEYLKQDPEISEAIDLLRNTYHVRGLKPAVLKASARKSKQISQDDLVKFVDFLQNTRGRWNSLSAMWLVATYNMGLRPCEWEKASITYVSFSEASPPELALRVVNAKATNGRSHGVYRHVPLSHLDAYSRETVIAFVHLLDIEMQSTPFDTIKQAVKSTIYRGSRACFTRRHKGVSMYTMRHQFTANTKNSLSLQETGALMGHAVSDTSKIHYAKARTGVLVDGIKAMESEVARVKKETVNPFASNAGLTDDQSVTD